MWHSHPYISASSSEYWSSLLQQQHTPSSLACIIWSQNFKDLTKKNWNETFNICSKFFLNIFTSFYLSDFKCLFVCSPLTSLYLWFAIKFLLFQLKSLLGITLQNGNQIEFSATSWIQSDRTYGNVNNIYW